jgi:hypothetical protein
MSYINTVHRDVFVQVTRNGSMSFLQFLFIGQQIREKPLATGVGSSVRIRHWLLLLGVRAQPV